MAIKLKEALCQSYRALLVSSYMLFRDTQRHNKPHVHVYYGELKLQSVWTANFLLVRFRMGN